jgi:hypothetical protein
MNVHQISQAVEAAFLSKQPLMVWGPPGVGKSDCIKQAAARLKVEFIDLRLPLLEPVDLRGLPHVDSKTNTAKWSQPSFLPTKGKGILILDEIAQAVPAMQAAASQLILDRRCGEYVLPDGWMVVGAGNLQSHRASAHSMPTHIANRFVHLYAEVSVDAWVAWALAHKIDVRVIAFLKWRSQLLHQFDPQAKGHAFPSPRSWAFVAGMLATMKSQPEWLVHDLVKGAVGEGPAAELMGFLKVFDKMPSIEQILLNPGKAQIATDPATLYAVVTALCSRASVDNINKIAIYLTRITEEVNRPEYSVAAMKEITLQDDARADKQKIGNTRAFIEWASKHNHVMV